ncbi:MAG: tripartite tricarboxylate transporter permease [Xanthobacteraceae bacterium]
MGSLCSLIPGTGPTIASFVAYATEKKISKHLIEGVVCPEASTHSFRCRRSLAPRPLRCRKRLHLRSRRWPTNTFNAHSRNPLLDAGVLSGKCSMDRVSTVFAEMPD